MEKKYLKIIPLGGIGEISRNCTVFENEDSIIVVDMGLGFSRGETPGIDYEIADTTYLEKNIEKVKAIFITHGHYDHVGAMTQMWKKVPVPVYATPYAIEVIKRIFDYKKQKIVSDLITAEYNKTYKINKDFSLEFVQMFHSVPQNSGLYFKINGKKIFHLSDFRIDDEALLANEKTDYKRLEEIKNEKLDLLLLDSTSVFYDTNVSETKIRENTLKCIQEAKQAVAICSFSTNILRAFMVLQLAEQTNRKVIVVGYSLQQSIESAIKTKLIDRKLVEKVMVPLDELGKNYQRNQIIILGTGSQGEEMSAIARLARDEFRNLRLEAGDTLIHSASAVPGNEMSVWNMFELMAKKGVEVKAKYNGHRLHVTGHASKDEILLIINALAPKVTIPVHGTVPHMQELEELIKTHTKFTPCTLNEREFIQIAENNMLEVHSFDNDKILKDTQRIAVDGCAEIPYEDYFIFRQRKFMNEQGAVFLSLAVDSKDNSIMAQPSITSKGLGDEDKLKEIYNYALINVYRDLKAKGMDKKIDDLEKAREVIRISARKAFIKHRGKKPMTVVDFVLV